MSRIPKTMLILMGLVLIVSAPSVFAQNGALSGDVQSSGERGSANETGSQLLYVVDTGVNVRSEVGPYDMQWLQGPLSKRDHTYTVGSVTKTVVNPYGMGGSKDIFNPNGTVNPLKVNTSFISITNTHPTQAVTIHFRYFTDTCEDVLDFLVVLTCNDTLTFNPFDFHIPKTEFNSVTRFYGPAQGYLTPIQARQFASGRFLIFANASGASTDEDDAAEYIFPNEFMEDYIGEGIPPHHCPNLNEEDNYGDNPNLVTTNLHVFNASAVAFNYLVGAWTNALPVGDDLNFQAYGLNAWTREAVDRWIEHPPLPVTGPGYDFRILTGTEIVRQANGTDSVAMNGLYLDQDVHGGENDSDGPYELVLDGALAAVSLQGSAPEDQLFNFGSFVDDYNGSKHAGDQGVAGIKDRSYNLFGATTTYVLQLYDNDENLFFFTEEEREEPINISPPPPDPTVAPRKELNIVVSCLRTWVTTKMDDSATTSTSVDDLQISDLELIDAAAMAHVTTQTPGVPGGDLAQGWIRFVRDNWNPASNGGVPVGTYVTDSLMDQEGDPSFVTIGFQVIKKAGFGAAWWLANAAYNDCVSDTGEPDCVPREAIP